MQIKGIGKMKNKLKKTSQFSQDLLKTYEIGQKLKLNVYNCFKPLITVEESYEQFISQFNFNDYLDRYTSALKRRITEKMDPLSVEPTETPFEYGGWFYSIKGILTLTNTKLHQLYKIRKTGTPQIEFNNKTVFLSWQMLFPEIKMTSDYALQVFNKTKKGEVRATLKDLLADVEFKYDVEKLKTKLNKIELYSNGPLDVELVGGDLSDSIGSVLLNVVAKVFKGEIMKSLEEAVKENIEEVLEGVHPTS